MEKTNPVLNRTVKKLEEKSREEDVNIWKDLADKLKKPGRQKNPVNLAKIDRHTVKGDTVVVPGKVTGYGQVSKKVNVAAFSFSGDAKGKIEKKGKHMKISDLMEENPNGKNVKIME